MAIRCSWSALVICAIAPCAVWSAEGDPPAAAAVQRSAIPSEDEQREKLELIRDVYSEQGEAAKTPAQKATFANMLLAEAQDTSNDPVGRYLLIRLARDAAVEAASVPIIVQAIDTMAADYEVDRDQLLVEVLTRLTKHVRNPQTAAEAVMGILDLIDDAIQKDEFVYAENLGKIVSRIAGKSIDSELINRVRSRNKEIHNLAKEYEEVEAALAVLDMEPSNAEANLTAGRFFCFLKNDWSTGLPMLALSSEKALANVAASELKSPEGAEKQVALGDQWQAAAEELKSEARISALSRAIMWYEKALPELKGLARSELEIKIETLQKSLPRSPSKIPVVPPGAVLVMTFDKDSIVKRSGEVFVQDLSGKGTHGAIRGAAHVSGVRGEALAFNGTTSYVDLGNPAQLQISGSQTISMWIWPDDLKDRRNPFSKAYGGEGTITLEKNGSLNYFYGTSGKNAKPTAGHASKAKVKPKQWNHIAVVRDLKARSITWYVNGTREPAQKARYPAAKPSALKTFIGKGYTKPFVGKIDELMVFNRALSQQEIGALIKKR